MATQARQRNAAGSLEESTQRLRIKESLHANESPSSPIDEDDEDGSEYNHEKDEFSDDGGGGAETPVTPFSPGRKKFPSEYKTIPCTFPGCTKTFNRPARMKGHLVTHTNERPFPCPYDGCDKTYIEDKHLQQHIKGTHTQERKWICDWEGCNKSFLTGTRLRRHKEAHEGHERFRCTGYPSCNKTFRKHQTLQRHIRSDHLELAPFPCTYIDPITKELCNAGFDGAVGLRKHVERVHSDPQFVCPSCTIPNSFNLDGTLKFLAFTTDSQLQSHIRKEHSDCMFCDKKCSSQRELQKHIESQHSGKTLDERKTIPCTYFDCGKTFTKKSNLAVHIRTVHNGERFICGSFDVSSNITLEAFDPLEHACGKDFTSKASLEDHIRTGHLGLPSLINSKRKKPTETEMDFDMDFIDDEDDDFAPKKKKRKARRQKPNVIDEQYDREVHLRAAHPVLTEAARFDSPFDFQPSGSFFQDGGGNGGEGGGMGIGIGTMTVQADIDWELQRQALDGGAFWVGAGESIVPNGDSWTMEEEEMRRLIDPDLFSL
ncbi:Transcription factor [Lachnellula hyalina]|uniref:Transcription factor n=1 Tax=Lachnellula hyalina TaxID=1316788 RepID=A0A8H8R9I7_9HELO|nr:Transcription factor [Lachnellula hyalina]TVY30047.1 Transcription factor [Lachnellula hyalina]